MSKVRVDLKKSFRFGINGGTMVKTFAIGEQDMEADAAEHMVENKLGDKLKPKKVDEKKK